MFVYSMPGTFTPPARIFLMKAESGANKLTVKREVSLNFVLVLAKFYPNVRDFYQRVRAGDEDQAVVSP